MRSILQGCLLPVPGNCRRPRAPIYFHHSIGGLVEIPEMSSEWNLCIWSTGLSKIRAEKKKKKKKKLGQIFSTATLVVTYLGTTFDLQSGGVYISVEVPKLKGTDRPYQSDEGVQNQTNYGFGSNDGVPGTYSMRSRGSPGFRFTAGETHLRWDPLNSNSRIGGGWM